MSTRTTTAVEAAIRAVPDPEIPVVSIDDLGIVRAVEVDEDGRAVSVTITPTYSGCPAMAHIEDAVRRAARREGYAASVRTVLDPPWSTDDIGEAGREKLRAFGIAPPAHRGRLVGLVQFNIVLGILLAYASNAAIIALVPGDGSWRWMLGVMVVPAVIFLVLLAGVPETPRWLMSVGRDEEGEITSRRLCSSEDEARAQIDEIHASIAADACALKVPFFTRGHARVIMMAVAIAFFNQMSGINAILYYAPTIFQNLGQTGSTVSLLATGVVGIV